MIGKTNAGGGSFGGFAYITVNTSQGVSISATNGRRTVRSNVSATTHYLTIPEAGKWTVTGTYGNVTHSKDVFLVVQDQTETVNIPFIYGISRYTDSSSPSWSRTNDSVYMSATASVGTTAGSSSFDDCYPWSEMKRETLSTGDVVVKIPKFYIKRQRESTLEIIQISECPFDGFNLHPAFRHNNTVQDYIYASAYVGSTESNTLVSKTGRTPAFMTLSGARDYVEAKGSGWGVLDISTVMAITTLMLVEFATNNLQSAIGKGYTNQSGGSSANTKPTGGCDGVPNLTGSPSTTTNSVQVVYRGIEDLWGNFIHHVDGLNVYNRTYYICNNQSSYATKGAYDSLSYQRPSGTNSGTWIKTLGYDAIYPAIMLPETTGASSSTYYCDGVYTGSDTVGWVTGKHGGHMNQGEIAGPFCWNINETDNTGNTFHMVYIPAFT